MIKKFILIKKQTENLNGNNLFLGKIFLDERTFHFQILFIHLPCLKRGAESVSAEIIPIEPGRVMLPRDKVHFAIESMVEINSFYLLIKHNNSPFYL